MPGAVLHEEKLEEGLGGNRNLGVLGGSGEALIWSVPPLQKGTHCLAVPARRGFRSMDVPYVVVPENEQYILKGNN